MIRNQNTGCCWSAIKCKLYEVQNKFNRMYVLTHTTKKPLKYSGSIIKNLVGRGDQTPDCCYNNNMIITPLGQTGCNN